METIRAFIAVDIGSEIRRQLAEVQRRLRPCHADIRWTNPQGIHLTLAFLGNLPIHLREPLEQALDQALQGMEPFDLEIAGTGTFGRPRAPRVVWAGIAHSPPLFEAQRRIVAALQTTGVAFDNKPFSPHLTLGRATSAKNAAALLDALEKEGRTVFGHVHVAAAELIQSELKPSGAHYTTLHRSAFSTA